MYDNIGIGRLYNVFVCIQWCNSVLKKKKKHQDVTRGDNKMSGFKIPLVYFFSIPFKYSKLSMCHDDRQQLTLALKRFMLFVCLFVLFCFCFVCLFFVFVFVLFFCFWCVFLCFLFVLFWARNPTEIKQGKTTQGGSDLKLCFLILNCITKLIQCTLYRSHDVCSKHLYQV